MPPVDCFVLRVTGYAHPDAVALVDRVQLEYTERYGSPDESHVDACEFEPPSGLFLVGYRAGVPVATGAWRVSPVRELGGTSAVEIKRMYVVSEERRRGLSRRILGELEHTAREAGHDLVVLETGRLQPEAIALYERSGYVPIPGFGHYACYPDSLSFAKRLS